MTELRVSAVFCGLSFFFVILLFLSSSYIFCFSKIPSDFGFFCCFCPGVGVGVSNNAFGWRVVEASAVISNSHISGRYIIPDTITSVNICSDSNIGINIDSDINPGNYDDIENNNEIGNDNNNHENIDNSIDNNNNKTNYNNNDNNNNNNNNDNNIDNNSNDNNSNNDKNNDDDDDDNNDKYYGACI